MRILLFGAALLGLGSLAAQEYVPPPTPTPTPTPIPGSQERSIRKLFLESTDLPSGLLLRKNLLTVGPEATDEHFARCNGVRIGYREWTAESQSATIFRLIDIRFAFQDDESAERYIVAAREYLSEGADGFESAPLVGENSSAYGSRLKVPGKADTEARGYIYLFRDGNIVAKLVFFQGSDAGDPLDVWTAARVAQKAIERMGLPK